MPHLSLSAAQEDYLEAIYLIAKSKRAARAKDIALALNVRAPSVTSALRSLSALELINYAPYDIITLTPRGMAMARDIFGRHTALRKFLITVLGVNPEEADQAACKMEHDISKPVLERLSKYAEYVERCPGGRAASGAEFAYFLANNCQGTDCENRHCLKTVGKKIDFPEK